jgi:hypothetical protein
MKDGRSVTSNETLPLLIFSWELMPVIESKARLILAAADVFLSRVSRKLRLT